MNNVREITERIETLRSELNNIEGTPTEIYARIVGYYRSLKNWNRGKREEYSHRVTYRPNRSVSSATPVTAPETSAESTADSKPNAEAESVARAHSVAEEAPSAETTLSTQGAETGGQISSYAYFYRETCPKCPSVKSYIDRLPISGEAIDVDTGEGMSAAVDHQILSTPTVVLFDEAGHRVAHAGSVDQLRQIMESVG